MGAVVVSKTCKYAIQALVYLAASDNHRPVLAGDLAVVLRVPRQFLHKVLQRMVKCGFLRSAKGPGGGFTLATPARAITLFDIVHAFQGTAFFDTCVLRTEPCCLANPCALHDRWFRIRNQIRAMLDHASIQDLLNEVRRGEPVLMLADDRRLARKVRRLLQTAYGA